MRFLLPVLLLITGAAYWAACTATPPVPTLPPDPLAAALSRAPSPVDVLNENAAASVMAATLGPAPAPTLVGRVHIVGGESACAGPGNPLPWIGTPRPKAGSVMAIDWTTAPTTPPALPPLPAALLVSLDTPFQPLRLDPWGATGCWLLVAPQWTIVPQPGTWFTQEGGRLRLRWTPDAWTVGRVWRMQLVVDGVQGAPSGRLVSPMVELVVGSP